MRCGDECGRRTSAGIEHHMCLRKLKITHVFQSVQWDRTDFVVGRRRGEEERSVGIRVSKIIARVCNGTGWTFEEWCGVVIRSGIKNRAMVSAVFDKREK